MSDVYREYYKLTGASFDVAEQFHKTREAAKYKWFELLKDIGGKSIAPRHDGTFRAVIFEEGQDIPNGWRKTGSDSDGLICLPHKGTKEGKEIAKALQELPLLLEYTELLRDISGELRGAMQFKGGNIIMFSTCQRLAFPKVQYLASIPRAIGDNLEIPADWEELSEGKYTLAFHEHNAEAARLRAENEEVA